MRFPRLALFALLALGAPAAAAALPVDIPLPAPADDATARPVTTAAGHDELDGTFRITAGSCGDTVSGSWFRMVQPGGDPDGGPFVENADSPCADKTYTPLRPGTDGGLTAGAHQPQPEQPFDAAGNGTAARITQPARFFGVSFAVATNATDPQTGTATGPPVVRRDGAALTGDLRAFAVAWNRQHFNQGAPKPDGTTPGATRLPSGTIDTATKAYRLEWASTIVGGPFNNFTGVWHLEGTFDGDVGGTGAQPAPSPDAPPAPVGAGTPGAPAPTTPNTGPARPAALGLALLAAGALLLRARRA